MLQGFRHDQTAFGGVERVTHSPTQAQKTLLIDLAPVFGAQKAIVAEHRRRALRILEIAEHSGLTAHQQLALLVHPTLDARIRQTTPAGAKTSGTPDMRV